MIRVFPHKTKWLPYDEFAFTGWPPLFRPPEQPVMVSVVFTWDILRGQQLQKAWSAYYRDVRLGGPALNDPGGDFVPGCFIKEGVDNFYFKRLLQYKIRNQPSGIYQIIKI